MTMTKGLYQYIFDNNAPDNGPLTFDSTADTF